MIINNIDFINIDLFKRYVDILKENKKNPGRNIEKLFNPMIVTIHIDELTPMEYMGLTKMMDEVKVLNFKSGSESCNLDKVELSDEYKESIKKAGRIYNSIIKEGGMNFFHYFYPFIGMEYEVEVTLKGYHIFSFFGTNITNIFAEVKDNDDNLLSWKDLLIQLFYDSFYNSLYSILDFSTLKTSDDVGYSDNIIYSLMDEEYYNKINKSKIKLHSVVSDKTAFHFIDSKDNAEEFGNTIGKSRKEDISIYFLCNTSLYTYFELLDNVIDTEPLKNVINRNNYIIDVNKCDKYKSRLNQLISEFHTERMYQLENDNNPVIQSVYLLPCISIKYILKVSFDKMESFIDILNNHIDKDIFGETNELISELNKIKKILDVFVL